ncbi:MAG: tol-pal system YbgF family protein [Polyangiales bacterium]
MRRAALILMVPTAMAGLLACGICLAQPSDPVAAEKLFRQGRASADAGDYPSACPAFAESLRLDPASGTLLNLADCEERIGRFASAWGHFKSLSRNLPPTDERLELAHQRAAALAPRVPWIAIELAPDAPRDTRVFRDDLEVDGAGVAAPWPADPGWHSVLVVAPGRESRSIAFVAVAGETLRVVALAGAPLPVQPRPAQSGHTAAWLLGAAGIASLGVGTYFGARAVAERSMSDAGCTGGVCMTPSELATYESARSDARVSDVALGLGIAALAAGAVLLITSGSGGQSASAFRASSAGVGGAW